MRPPQPESAHSLLFDLEEDALLLSIARAVDLPGSLRLLQTCKSLRDKLYQEVTSYADSRRLQWTVPEPTRTGSHTITDHGCKFELTKSIDMDDYAFSHGWAHGEGLLPTQGRSSFKVRVDGGVCLATQ